MNNQRKLLIFFSIVIVIAGLIFIKTKAEKTPFREEKIKLEEQGVDLVPIEGTDDLYISKDVDNLISHMKSQGYECVDQMGAYMKFYNGSKYLSFSLKSDPAEKYCIWEKNKE